MSDRPTTIVDLPPPWDVGRVDAEARETVPEAAARLCVGQRALRTAAMASGEVPPRQHAYAAVTLPARTWDALAARVFSGRRKAGAGT